MCRLTLDPRIECLADQLDVLSFGMKGDADVFGVNLRTGLKLSVELEFGGKGHEAFSGTMRDANGCQHDIVLTLRHVGEVPDE